MYLEMTLEDRRYEKRKRIYLMYLIMSITFLMW